MKRSLFLISLLLIGSTCAMEHEATSGITRRSCEATETGTASSSSAPEIQDYVINGEIYHLNPDHAIEFVWTDGTRRSLTAEQVVKLNSAFIGAKLRTDTSGLYEQDHGIINADEIISPALFDFLSTLIDTNHFAEPPVMELTTTLPKRPLPILSRSEHKKLAAACDFLQTNCLNALPEIKKYLIVKYVQSEGIDAFGINNYDLQLLETLEPIDIDINVDLFDLPIGSPIFSFDEVLQPGIRTAFRRIHGNRWYYIFDAQFSADYQYVATNEGTSTQIWHVVPIVSPDWHTQQPDKQYLIYVPLDGSYQVWQLSDAFEGLTWAQKLLIKQASIAEITLTTAQINHLAPIYWSLPANIRQILPTAYQQHFSWLSWFAERNHELLQVIGSVLNRSRVSKLR